MPPGYHVDPDAVDKGGRTACDLAEDLRTTRANWDKETRDGADACGLSVAQKAYTEMQDAWFDEVGVHVKILEQLCAALRNAAKSYRAMEDAGSASFGGTGVE
jgi:uncharacterized protein YukE